MGAYLDRLNSQYDEIRDGITALIDRAAEQDRDVTESEQAQVDRDRGRMDELQTAIQHYTDLETRAAAVGELRRSAPVPAVTRTSPAGEPDEYDISREFPTPGDYAITVHRATMLRDPEARERLDRATAHQTTADNPGIIPRPVVGPLLNLLNSSRPFINSITRRPLEAGKFDRPRVTQHVAVGKQAAEKQLTESQKMLVDTLPVTAATYAGHLNISRQDIKWTSPGILNLIYEDFAAMYALATCEDASTQFVASVTNDVPLSALDYASVVAALYSAAADSITAGGQVADTLWVSPDVWGAMGSLINEATGSAAFPGLSLGSTSGNPLGLRLVVDEHFAAQTMIAGPARFAEWYEDVDGLMSVGEPDVLGQLVGYAGYGAFINVNPAAFTQFTVPTIP